jgi:hypothetical protein
MNYLYSRITPTLDFEGSSHRNLAMPTIDPLPLTILPFHSRQ